MNTLPPPLTDRDRSRIKRNSRIELWICLGAGALAMIAVAIFG